MHAILQEEEWRINKAAIISAAVAGWALFDEIDMRQGPDRGYTTLHDDTEATRLVNDFQQVARAGLFDSLNGPFADDFVSASPSVRTMAKFHENKKYYVFAGSNVASTPTFSLISAVDSGTTTIPISNGQFSESLADGNAIHIYRFDSH